MSPGTAAEQYQELMQILSVPRPNGSPAEVSTRQALQNWLSRRSIPSQIHTFRQFPFYFEALGVWLIATQTLLAAAVWLDWGWWALVIAVVGVAVAVVEMALHLPLVTWIGARQGENILITFEPQGKGTDRELIYSAHYDSKTEPLDHNQRMFLLKSTPAGIVLSLGIGVLAASARLLATTGSPWSTEVRWVCVVLTVPLLLLAWPYGLNLSLGRLIPQSQGAVDNGAACAILLGLANRLKEENNSPQNTRLVLALFTGEEVDRQGSRAYAGSREWPLPAAVCNMEAMAQDGSYVVFEQDGSIFGLSPTSKELTGALADAVQQATGQPPQLAGPVLSDAAPFLSAGLPVAVLGTYDQHLKHTGFHRPADNMDRVVLSRLPEGVEILYQLLKWYDGINLFDIYYTYPSDS